MINLDGKVAIVTGAARGIGKEIAAVLAEAGARVVVNDIDADLAKAAANDIGGLSYGADITNPTQVLEMINYTFQQFGRIDILVNNAGVIQLKAVEDITLEDWNKMMNVHLTGSFLCSKAVLPQMKKQQSGKIINISSNWGQRGAAEALHYCTVKAGIIGFTKALARELASDGIKVNAVAPGPIETEMIKTEAEMLGISVDEVRANLTKTIPLGRLGKTKDVAGTVAFLASELGDFFCGQIIAPNGGEVI